MKPVVRCVSCAFTCTCGVFFFFNLCSFQEDYTFILHEFPGFQTGFIIQLCFLHPLLSSITVEPEMEHSRGRWRVNKKELAPGLAVEATGASQRSLGSGFWRGLFNILAAQ